MPRKIKRYANRKLYDTVASKYVTLTRIADMVRDGEEVIIIDNTTKEDLTAVTLAQILFEGERNERVLPLNTLRSLIQSGGEFFEKKISRPVTSLRQQTERRVHAARAVINKSENDAREFVTQFVDSTQKSVDDFQVKVEERFQGVMHSITQLNKVKDEVFHLQERLDSIEKRLAKLESKLGAK